MKEEEKNLTPSVPQADHCATPPRQTSLLAQSFSPFFARDGRQTCRPAMNFSVTKMQEENKIAQLIF
jgi:hypothetical protein